MTTPPEISDAERVERIAQDGEDRRFAAGLAAQHADIFTGWEGSADRVYAWLRSRASTAPSSLVVTPGVPTEGAPTP